MPRIAKRLLPLLTTSTVIACIWVWMRLDAMHVSELQVTVVEVQNPEAPPSQWKVTPLPGAEVTAIWGGSKREDPINLHAGGQRCMGMQTALTNADGKAIFPRWKARWGDYVFELNTFASMTGYVPVPHPNYPGTIWQDETGRHFMHKGSSPQRSSREVAREGRCQYFQ